MKGNFNNIINGDQPVLVDFYADWCGPCKMQAPILKEVSSEIGGKARIIKIDVDKNQPIAQQYQVRGVPTLILFKKGQPLWRQSGVATKQQLIDLINQNA
ncbi:thioredoxin [Roseivirga sp. UBA838]|uniref:thioredoxin n=1 Tax=Roseivirga sp. UBA838 TaxID=1947393 RepID=UPI00257FD17C|nr:thioredoxin [Roseivirga sp. UBA838]|tara:strand:- start:17741 stop:18040 length:300 start_codon:yes stop_codon:yes gene_type:complete